MTDKITINETDTTWIIIPEYSLISGYLVDFAIRLHMTDKQTAPNITISFCPPFLFRKNEDAITVDTADSLQKIAEQLSQQMLLRVVIDKKGYLEINTSNEISVYIPFDPDYEAWIVNVEGISMWVCTAEGGIAYWPDMSK